MSDSPLRCANVEQVGPENKEYNLWRAEEEFKNGNEQNAIFYQVKALFQALDTRHCYIEESETGPEFGWPGVDEIVSHFDDWEKANFETNTFMQSCVAYLRKKEEEDVSIGKMPANRKCESDGMDFLANFDEPKNGMARVEEMCNEMPTEWTIIQLTKSFNPATTTSVFKEIYGSSDAIYLTLLRHCRSPEYPPICLRLPSQGKTSIFEKNAQIIERFKSCIMVNLADFQTADAKQQYWRKLGEFADFLESCIAELHELLNPWCFLFKGRHYGAPNLAKHCKDIFKRVDKFCNQHKWDDHRRVLLSQAALQAGTINQATLRQLCSKLASKKNENEAIYSILKDCADQWNDKPTKRFPTILVVDERMDHFFWEQLDVTQEFSRVKSLHCLCRLYNSHKSSIKSGYYALNLQSGFCVVNPDGNLANSGKRLRGFFEYWLPHWQKRFETKPKENELREDAFKKDCYVYAGHGSGLQYISGKKICKSRIDSVVFLFGCDSTRMTSNGLYSTLIGPHNYYHGALCPTVIGTLMPALDANMDLVAVHTLSRWIAPTEASVTPWNLIDLKTWIKTGEVKPSAEKTAQAQSKEYTIKYNAGSICKILTHVQQRLVDSKIYNSCIYVCRGLPAWNTNVEPLPDGLLA